MVGVSNPIMRRDRAGGRRFLAGFGLGLAVATGLVTAVLLPLHALAQLAPEPMRAGLLVALAVTLGLADILNRTPHVRRQVLQRLARELGHQPGRLGFIWAVDLGLWVTTQ